MDKLISVLIPERGRPESLERLISSLIDTAAGDERYEIIVAIDNDDEAWTDREPFAHSHTRYLRRPRPATLGEKLNDLAKEARGDLLWFIANDMQMETRGWPVKFREAGEKLPNGVGIAYVKDPTHPHHTSYWMMTRVMFEGVGFFAAPWFPYWFVDTWWDEISHLSGLRVQIDAEVSAPDGNERSGRFELDFWVRFFEATRPLRLRDSIQLIEVAYGANVATEKNVEMMRGRVQACQMRAAHMQTPEFLERWSGGEQPSPQYPEVRAIANKLMTDVQQQAPRRVKVGICVPSGRDWEAAAANSVAAMAAFSAMAGIEIAMINVQSSLISHSRNMTVRMALEAGVDYLMWIDSDMKFPPNTLMRLLHHGKDIVGATYNKRTPRADGSYETLGRMKGPRPEKIEGLLEAEQLPGGMMLVKADVYRKLPEPWYAECRRWPGANGLERFGNMLRDYFTDEPPLSVLKELEHTGLGAWLMNNYRLAPKSDADVDLLGEDLFFCRKAAKAGLSLWCDIDLTHQVSHLGVIEVTCLPPKKDAA